MLCYIVCAEHPDYVLTVKGENREEQKKEGQKLEIQHYTGDLNQQFAIFDRAIAAVVTGQEGNWRDPENPCMVLEPEEINDEKANVVIKSSKDHPTEWFFNADKTISTRDGKYVLDVEGNKFDDGTDVIIYKPNNGGNQKWLPVTVYDGERKVKPEPSSSSSSSSSSSDEKKKSD